MVIAVLLAISETFTSVFISDRFTLDVTYAFIRDAELTAVALSIMIYLTLSPASFVLKAFAHGFAVIQIVTLIVNVLLQVGILPDESGVFLAVSFILMFVIFRNVLAVMNFKPDASNVVAGSGVWLIYQRPTTFMTWLLFALDSGSGHYAATDGINAWYFSRNTGRLIKEPVAASWLAGKMATKITDDNDRVIKKLDALTGTKFTVFTNCATTFRWL